MPKKYITIAVFVIIIAIVAIPFLSGQNNLAPAPAPPSQPATPAVTTSSGPKNAKYLIENRAVTLVDGRAESDAAPGSASKIVTQYFGNEATGDLNGDGIADTAFILTQSTGGTGIFYYVAVALGGGGGDTNAIFLGDRIAPQTTEIRSAGTGGAELIVNYADRKPGEPFSAAPTVGVSKYFKVSATGQLVPAAN